MTRRSTGISLFLGVLSVFSTSTFGAAVVTVTDPNARYVAPVATCTNRTGTVTYGPCASTAYISTTPASEVSPYVSPNTFNGTPPNPLLDDFQEAFNTWNGARPVAQQWTIKNGGALDLSFQVVDFEAQANNPNARLGGLDIVIDPENYAGKLVGGAAGPAAGTLAWVQGLYINYQPGKNLAAPVDTLDTFSFSGGPSGSGPAFSNPCTPIPAGNPSTVPPNLTPDPANQRAYCDPLYPFQNAPGGAGQPNGFGDAPRGFWDIPASFRGIALLATLDTTTNTMTVYNGVSYGFDLTTPEPYYLPVLLAIFGAVLFVRYRKARVRG